MILVPHRMVFRPRPSASASASARLQAAGAGFAALSRCRIGCCCNVVGVGLCAKRSYSSKLNRPRSTRARPWQSPLPPPPPPSTLDEIVPPTVPPTDVQAAALRQFIENHPRLLVLTGAGLSTESGIPDYRSPKGAYSKGHKPITWQQFAASTEQRQRYWARAMAGWEFMSSRKPNAGHHAVVELASQGRVERLVTQNVDRLHSAAGSTDVVELHGSVFRVDCPGCGHSTDREDMQLRLSKMNPHWDEVVALAKAEAAEAERRRAQGTEVRPDGDTDLQIGEEQYKTLRLPSCTKCGHFLKPGVVLFGENVPSDRVAHALAPLQDDGHADALLVLGSSLQVFSAFRFCRTAAKAARHIPIGIVNAGPTRADDMAMLKIDDVSVGEILSTVVRDIVDSTES